MNSCKVCQKPILSGRTYCKKCLNDPTPIRLMKADRPDSSELIHKVGKKRTIMSAFLIVGSWFLGFLFIVIIVIRWAVLDSDPEKSSAPAKSISTSQQTTNVPSYPTMAENEKASSLALQQSSSSQDAKAQSSAENHIVQNFARVLTEQYI
jgi:hypothetical protein